MTSGKRRQTQLPGMAKSTTVGEDYHPESDGGPMELISLSPDGSQTPTCKSSERDIRQAGGTMDFWHTFNC